MKVNTALCLFLLSLAGLCFSAPEEKSPFKKIGFLFAGLTGVIALLSLLEYIFHFDAGIDEFWISDFDGRGGLWPPGRPAPITLINFLSISIAYVLEVTQVEKWKRVQQALVIGAWILAFQGFIGYTLGINYTFGSAFYTQIAIHTAASFILLTTAFMVSKPSEGFMRILSRESISGKIGRTLLTWAILFPPLVNWIQLQGTSLGIWDADFGTLIRVVANVAFFSWLALSVSSKLSRAEEARQSAASGAATESEKRKTTESRLQLITNAVPALIAYVDADGRYQFANQTYESWFGQKPEDVIGKTIGQVLGDAYPPVAAHIQMALTGSTVQFVNSIVTPKGTPLTYEGHYIPDRSADGKVQGFALIGHDITERIQVEKTLEHSIKGRDELLSICSHELKTPITTMKLSTQIFKRAISKGNAELTTQELVGRMMDQTDRQLNRLTRLIDEMLDFSAIHGGQLRLHAEKVDLAGLVAEVYEDMRAQFEAVGTLVSFENTGNTIASCDRKRIEQVVMNLFSNTLKYGEGKPAKVSVSGNEKLIRIQVQDFGMGISADAQERIFEAYERAVSVYNISGLGLGLYISREIMRAHQGRIEVESELGQGTTFTVVLPLSQVAV